MACLSPWTRELTSGVTVPILKNRFGFYTQLRFLVSFRFFYNVPWHYRRSRFCTSRFRASCFCASRLGTNCRSAAWWSSHVRLLTVTPWPARTAAGEWVSEWASLRYVRTSYPYVCGHKSADFFGSADWQLIMETRYNTLHYNANSVIMRLPSWLPIFLGATSSHSMNSCPWCVEIKDLQTCSHPPTVCNKRQR